MTGAHAQAHLPYMLSQTLVLCQPSLPQDRRWNRGQRALNEQRFSSITDPKNSKSYINFFFFYLSRTQILGIAILIFSI